jgi:predicted nucleic acid-binding protein
VRVVPETPPYVFDNDCISSFLWVKRLDILLSLFWNQIIVPKVVVTELNYLTTVSGGRWAWVYHMLESKTREGAVSVWDVAVGTEEADEFIRLTRGTGHKGKLLGKGEAAVLVLTRYREGTAASNNLSDVAEYCRQYGVNLISTDDILCLACHREVISLSEGEEIWNEMKARKRMLPAYTFSESFHRYCEGLPK